MMPRLGEKYSIEIQVVSHPKAHYNTDEYFELDLPVAPAVMVGDEIVVEGSDLPLYDLESSICRHLDLPLPQKEEKGLFGKLFKR